MCDKDDKETEEILELIDEVFSDVEDISSDTFHVFNIDEYLKCIEKRKLLN